MRLPSAFTVLTLDLHRTQDIWRPIHSLMPFRDAARAACVCRASLYSWRSFPNLTFSNQTLGFNEKAGRKEIIRDFTNRVDHIIKNHLGTGVKTLKLLGAPYSPRYQRCLDSWLEKVVTPGIEDVTLCLDEHFTAKKYKFPCSILSHGNGDSIQRLDLAFCALLSLGKALQVKKLNIDCSGPICVSSSELASCTPNLEAGIHPNNEVCS